MTASIQVPVTLRPSLMKATVLFLLCALFVVGGIWMIGGDNKMGYFVAGFFALGLPVFALQFHPRSAYLHLAAEGFTFCSLFRAYTVRWDHVREFALIQVGPNRMVAWDFTSGHPMTGRVSAISKSLAGVDAALPDTYGMKPQELFELMESLRRRYSEKQHA